MSQEIERENSKGEVGFDLTKSRSQMLVIMGVRLGFLLVILGITLVFQATQPEFINTEVLLPVYWLLAGSFFVNALYLGFYDRALRNWFATATLFFTESLFITFLIHYTGVSQSIFLFLYLVNIILGGFVFQRRGSILLSLWTSILFAVLMIVGPEIQGQTLFLAVGLNNLAFFAVAWLSGFLSEQINFMGSALQRQGKDLRALKNLNSIIIDNITTGLVTVTDDGVILVGNRAAIEILDPSVAALEGQKIDQVIPGLMEKITEWNLARGTPLQARVAERFDHVYTDDSGDKLTLEMIVSSLPVDAATSGYIVTFQDLTKVRRLEYQMRQSEKMAAVGSLAAGIAHEIRNPLASISGSIQLLETTFTSRQEEERRLMAIVLREIDRLNNLISEFLDFVRPDAMRDEAIEVNSLIREVFEILRLNRGLRAEVEQILDLKAVHSISGNRDKLKQALMNIIINAYQAMLETKDPAVIVSTLDRDGRVVIKIRDRGVGIEEKGLRKIFEPFHTTKPKGTGLGLAVTHKIIENHGGQVFVESAKGVGTEFTLEFPIRDAHNLDKNALADSQLASENFQIAFRGQKRSNG